MDRYNHDIGDDTDDTDDSPLFGSFSSYSPQSRKISQTRPPQINSEQTELDISKKQLFRTELERTVAQLSSGSNSSITPPSKLAESTLPEKIDLHPLKLQTMKHLQKRTSQMHRSRVLLQ